MKKNYALLIMLISVSMSLSALDNPFTIKKERKINKRTAKQHCCEYCADIIKKMPTVNRSLAQLQRALIGKSADALLTLLTHVQERMVDIQELLQEAIENYWNSEKQGMWQEAPANRFAQLENTLKELMNFMASWSPSLALTLRHITQDTVLKPNQIKALTGAMQEKEQRLKKFLREL